MISKTIVFYCVYCGYEQEVPEGYYPAVPCPECMSTKIECEDPSYKVRARKGKDNKKGKLMDYDE